MQVVNSGDHNAKVDHYDNLYIKKEYNTPKEII